MMKKKILSIAIAGAMGSLAGLAYADYFVQPNGVGKVLIVPYYSAENGNHTLLNIVNTDTVNGKAVKVRFRGAVDSDDVFDFQVFLSPGDMWTADVSSNNGVAHLTTTDTSCTLPSNVNQDFVTGRLAGTTADKNAQTLEGYIEVLTMGNIPPKDQITTTASNPLYTATKHDQSVSPPTPTCMWDKSTTLTSYVANLTTKSAIDAFNAEYLTGAGYATSDGGVSSSLMANWTIINVPNTTVYSNAAIALDSWDYYSPIYFPQSNQPLSGAGGAGYGTDITPYTDDAVLTNYAETGVVPALYDLPDLSTPHYTTSPVAGNAATQAAELSQAFMSSDISNEYITESGISASTDWVISMPTRRFHVAGRGADYGAAKDGKGTDDVNLVVATTSSSNVDNPFMTPGAGNHSSSNYTDSLVTYAAGGRSSCVKVGTYSFYGREEETPTPGGYDIVISPGTPNQPQVVSLCGEVNIISFGDLTGLSYTPAVQAAVGGAGPTTVSIAGMPAADGWADLSTGYQQVSGTYTLGDNHWGGLPVVGQAFVKAYNPAVAAGVSGNFGGTWMHRPTVNDSLTGSPFMNNPWSNLQHWYIP